MNFLFAGDFYPCSKKSKRLIKMGEYDTIISGITPYVKKADFSIVNFESPIADIKKQIPFIGKGPRNLASDITAIKCLKYAGFSMLALANNHFHDYGDEGVMKTIESCESLQIPYCGAGQNLDEAQKVKYVQCKEKILAIINFCENEFSVATPRSAGANPYDIVDIAHQITEARNNADYVIVFVHGGIEHYQLPTPKMQKHYRYFVEVGADMVVNSHQHCFSGYEFFMGKPIIYGLGNLFFDDSPKVHTSWNDGYMVLIKDDNSTYELELIPYHQGFGDHTITIVENKTQFNNRIQELNNIISSPTMLQLEFEKIVKDNNRNYLAYFEPYNTRIALKLYRMGLLPSMLSAKKKVLLLNRIRCESHQQVYSKALSLSLNLPF